MWTKDAGLAAWHGLFSDVLGAEMCPAVRDLLCAVAGVGGEVQTHTVAGTTAHGLLPLDVRALDAAAAAALAGERAESRDNRDGVALALQEFRAASKPPHGSSGKESTTTLVRDDRDLEEELPGVGPLWCYGEATLETNGPRGTARESEIVAMLQRGALSPRARVWSVGRVDWVEAVSVPRFRSAVPSASPDQRRALRDADTRAAETLAAEPPRGARQLFGARDRARAFAKSVGVATASTGRTLEDRVAALGGELILCHRYILCANPANNNLTSIPLSTS